MLSTLTWLMVAYISAGLFILMEALVYAWKTTKEHVLIKFIGSLVAVLAWPIAFIR